MILGHESKEQTVSAEQNPTLTGGFWRLTVGNQGPSNPKIHWTKAIFLLLVILCIPLLIFTAILSILACVSGCGVDCATLHLLLKQDLLSVVICKDNIVEMRAVSKLYTEHCGMVLLGKMSGKPVRMRR